VLSSILDRIRGKTEEAPEQRDHLLALAAGALLIEVAWADHDIATGEMAVIRSALSDQFELSKAEVDEIIRESRDQHDESVGLYAFTRTLVEAWDEQRRFELLVSLWRLAYSDANLDRFEEHTIRKISELLYVSHARFIEAKRTARDAAE